MRKTPKEVDGSYMYVISKREIKKMILNKYGHIIKKTEKLDEIDIHGDIAILVSPNNYMRAKAMNK